MMLNVYFLLLHRRIDFDNTVSRDHAISALAMREEFASERGAMSFQYGNGRTYIDFALENSAELAYSTLLELNKQYAQVMNPLYVRARRVNRLQSPMEVPLDKQVVALQLNSMSLKDLEELTAIEGRFNDEQPFFKVLEL